MRPCHELHDDGSRMVYHVLSTPFELTLPVTYWPAIRHVDHVDSRSGRRNKGSRHRRMAASAAGRSIDCGRVLKFRSRHGNIAAMFDENCGTGLAMIDMPADFGAISVC